MASKNPFLDIRVRAGEAEKSLSWYKQQVRSLSQITPTKLLSNAPDLTNTILPGSMYMFFYDAKHKEKLPYFDMFPLVLPFRKVSGGFLGLNLHYIPYAMRFKLLGYMHEYATDAKIDEDTRVRINWRILDSSSRLSICKPCVKHYLYEQLQSRFLKIKYPDWITASLLPVERFVGANKTTVWEDSRNKI